LHEIVRAVGIAAERDRKSAQARNDSEHGITHGWLKHHQLDPLSSRLFESLVVALGRYSDAGPIIEWRLYKIAHLQSLAMRPFFLFAYLN
jgi:hypothetical protein